MASINKDPKYRIYNAVIEGASLKKVEDLLAKRHSPDSKPRGCPPPLYRAVLYKKPDIALALIKAGCQVNLENYEPVVCVAANLNMTEVVVELFKHQDCDKFHVDNDGRNCFHIAVLRKNYLLIKRLWDYCDHLDIRKLLLQQDVMCLNPVHLAAFCDDFLALKLFLEQAKYSDSMNSVFSRFSGDSGGAIAECPSHPKQNYSRENHVSHSTENKTLLEIWESFSWNFPQAEESDKRIESLTPEKLAAIPLLELHLIHLPVKGDYARSHNTLLHFAAENHNTEMINFLIKRGADVNGINFRNETPLLGLLHHGHADSRGLKAARALLNAGAAISLTAGHEYEDLESIGFAQQVTPSKVAATRNKVCYLRLLAEYGDEFDSVCTLKRTPLMWALLNSSEEAAWFLLTKCPQKNWFFTWSDVKNLTALHYVSYCHSKADGHKDAVGVTDTMDIAIETKRTEYLTDLMLKQGYGASLKLGCSVRHVCDSNCVCYMFPGRYEMMSPAVQAIGQRQLGVLKMLVAYNSKCLPKNSIMLDNSPLHVTVETMPDENCAPFIDFLLQHGCDGNAVVSGYTPYEYGMKRRLADGRAIFAVEYIKKKLGASFLHPSKVYDGLRHNYSKRLHQDLWCSSLKNICLHRTRQLVRQSQDDYYGAITSLEVPQTVIQELLFQGRD